MDAKVELIVKPQLLRSIGKVWNKPLSPISPLKYDMEGQAPVDNKGLTEAAICDKDGILQPLVRPALEVLANARTFSRIYLTKSPGNIFEYIVYITPDGKTASIVNEGGNQRINCPAAIEDVFVGLGQFVGASTLRNCEFAAELSTAETLVVSVLLDLQRKTYLSAIADDKELGPVSITKDKFAALVSENKPDHQWFVSVFKEMLDVHGTFMEEVVPVALDGLISKGLIKKEGGFYSLSDNLQYLSRRMLLIERFITVTSGRLDEDDKLALVGFTCLQSGINDILMADAMKGSARLETISSAKLLDYLGVFMTPDKLNWPGQSTKAAPSVGRVTIGSSKRP